jgi:signal transduction histidine kinase
LNEASSHRPQVLDRSFERKLAASYFAPLVITLSLLAAVVLWRFYNQASSAGWVEHTDQVILRIHITELELREMQSAFSGYLLTSDKRYLTDLGNARDALEKNIEIIAALIAENSDQGQRLLEINDLKGTWIKAIESLIRRTDRGKNTREAVAEAHAQAQTVFNSLEKFIAEQHQLRAQRAAHQATEYYVSSVLLPLLTLFVIVYLGYWGWRQIQLAVVQFDEALDIAERARDEAEKASVRAEKANRAKDNFIGTVSHELRNPLNSIILWSNALLRNLALGENTRRGLTAIERAARAQAQLIDDLLDISRIESGRMRLDVQLVDLAEVVKAGVEGMRAAAEAKFILLQEIMDPRIDCVVGDPGRLQQVVWNLICNAVKFTPNGGKIQVRVERINSHVEISITDTGQGIEPAALRLVFDRFWQADDAAQTKHGVGLGLSIVKEIVSLHGGTVVAQSEGAGKGSTFTVRLPLPLRTVPSVEPPKNPSVLSWRSEAVSPNGC